jgi:hypothetical protein
MDGELWYWGLGGTCHTMDNKLEPLYYLIGYLVVSNLGSIIIKFFDRDASKDKAFRDLTASVIRLETKMEIFTKNLNDLGKKLRGG